MNINDLTIGEVNTILEMFSKKNEKSTENIESSFFKNVLGKNVIVRSGQSGVHIGFLAEAEGQSVRLIDSRRLWYWVVKDKKGISLSDVATYGLSDESKVCAPLGEIVIHDVCEIIPVSDVISKSIWVMKTYKP